MASVQPVATEFVAGNYRHRQLERHGDVAIYEQRHRENPAVIRYEVVKLRVVPEHIWPNGIVTPEREEYPGASSWGKRGWTFFTLADAQAHAQTLVQEVSLGGVLALAE